MRLISELIEKTLSRSTGEGRVRVSIPIRLERTAPLKSFTHLVQCTYRRAGWSF